MRVEFNFKKSYFLIGVFMFLIFAGVVAYNQNFDYSRTQAGISGHSADEVVVKMSDNSLRTVQELLKDGVGSGGTAPVSAYRTVYSDYFDSSSTSLTIDGNTYTRNEGLPFITESSGKVEFILNMPLFTLQGADSPQKFNFQTLASKTTSLRLMVDDSGSIKLRYSSECSIYYYENGGWPMGVITCDAPSTQFSGFNGRRLRLVANILN
jgi:hypothetical protein